MAKRKLRAPKRKAKKVQNPEHWPVWAAMFLGTMTTIFIALISVQVALLSFGIFSMAILMYAEVRRRHRWEMAIRRKLKKLSNAQNSLGENHDDIAIDVRKNAKDIRALKTMLAAKPAVQKSEDAPIVLDQLVSAPPTVAPKAQETPFQNVVPKILRAVRAKALVEDQDNFAPVSDMPAADVVEQDEFDSLSDHVVRELLHHAMSQNRLDVFVQPVVRLPQRQLKFFEMFARIRARPGQYLPASRYMPIAEQDNLQDKIDQLLLMHCLDIVRQTVNRKRAVSFFININDSTLKNGLFMQRLLEFVSKNRALAPRLIFELQRADFEGMAPALLDIIKGLGQLGCAFSLDHVDTLALNIADLRRYKVRFVKIDCGVMLSAAKSEESFKVMRADKRALESSGVRVVVTKIENEVQMRDVMDYEVGYGQGYLFGRPDLEGAYQKGVAVTG